MSYARSAPSNPYGSRVAGGGHWAPTLASIGLFIATFLLTRQTQVPAMSGLGAPWALLLVAVGLRWQSRLFWLLPVSAYGAVSLIASLLVGNDAANAGRFLIVTLATLLAFHFRPISVSVCWTLLPVAAQAALIIVVSIGLGALQDAELAGTVRGLALESNWGDIYSFDGLYYRVQVIGNALIPLLFLISLWRYHQSRSYRFLTALSLIGLIAAGNLTYSIVAGLAILMRAWPFMIRRASRRIAFGLILCLALGLVSSGIDNVVERKFDGTDSSIGIRADQLNVAASLWSDSPIRFIFGAGLGANFPDGREREYSQYQYIELQSLYLLVQLGVLGMALYLITLAVSARHFLSPDGQWIFWLYMLSGATNPYILDTNQIVATVLLICLFPRKLPAISRRGRALWALCRSTKRTASCLNSSV